MAVNVSPFGPKPQFELSSGAPAVGNQLFFYVAGSVSTKQNTYTSSTGLVANTNPVILDALGMPTNCELWFTAGQAYKVVYAPSTDTDPPTSPIWTIDNLRGINDTSVTFDEWVVGPAPTYVSAVSFTLVGDQTSTFSEGRRVKVVDSGGTKYGTITGSAFGALTTITIAGDALATPTSSVSYGLISATNPSISSEMVYRKGTALASAATIDIWNTAGDFVHITGATGPITSFGTAPYAGAERTLIFDSTPTLTYNATTLQIEGGATIVMAAGDRAVVRADTTANMIVTQITRANGMPVFGTQTANTVFAGPSSGAAAVPTFRALVGIESSEVLIGALQTASGSATISFDATSYPTAFDGSLAEVTYHWQGGRPSTDAQVFQMQIGTGAGPTYQTGGADYQDAGMKADATAITFFGAARAYISLSAEATVGNAATKSMNGRASVDSLANTVFLKEFMYDQTHTTSGGTLQRISGAGQYQGAAAAITGVRFKFAAGNIAEGIFWVTGKRKA